MQVLELFGIGLRFENPGSLKMSGGSSYPEVFQTERSNYDVVVTENTEEYIHQ